MAVRNEASLTSEPISALLRYPTLEVHRRIARRIRGAGFYGFRLPHMGIFLYSGPDGVSPGTLVRRTGVSKQAMHQFLKSLERSGYLVRTRSTADRRRRHLYMTERGRAAWQAVDDVLCDLEAEWAAALGAERFAELKQSLWDLRELSLPQR